jgi:hypothetical protein
MPPLIFLHTPQAQPFTALQSTLLPRAGLDKYKDIVDAKDIKQPLT